MELETSEQIIVRVIMSRFPDADLSIKIVDDSKVYEISQFGKLVIVMDHEGAERNYPTRGKSTIKWQSIIEGGPEQIAEWFLRGLADADFKVIAKNGKPMKKSLPWKKPN